MIRKYRGFELNVRREKSMAGYDLIFYDIMRICDGWELTSGFSDCEDLVKDFMDGLKSNIDEYHEDPSEYEDEDFLDWFGEDVKNAVENDDYIKVCVCKKCARPFVIYNCEAFHQVDSSGTSWGKPCACGGGEQ